MTEAVMILRGTPDGGRTPYDGQFLKSFDFEAAGGRGEVVMTNQLDEAKVFPSAVDVFQFMRQVPECKPLREDGRPNRPLTATNWEVRQLADLKAEANG
jgi:hypothetical protein